MWSSDKEKYVCYELTVRSITKFSWRWRHFEHHDAQNWSLSVFLSRSRSFSFFLTLTSSRRRKRGHMGRRKRGTKDEMQGTNIRWGFEEAASRENSYS